MTRAPNFYEPFDGPSDALIEPIPTTTPTRNAQRPTAVTAIKARAIVDRFVLNGNSAHSEAGETLWVVLSWSERHRRHIRIVESYVGDAFSGFWVKLMDVPDAPDDGERAATQF